MTSKNDPDLFNLDEQHVIKYTKIPEFQKGGIIKDPSLRCLVGGSHDNEMPRSFLDLNIPQVDDLIEKSLQRLIKLVERKYGKTRQV